MQYHVIGGRVPGVLGADVLIRGGIISDSDANTHVFVAQMHNNVFRIAGPAITHHANAVMKAERAGWGNSFLYGSTSDATPPAITSSASQTAVANVNFAHILGANEPVTWSIVGFDAASFKLVPDRSTGTLTMPAVSGPRSVK